MKELLQKEIKDAPTNPGVYRYYDKDGKLLYVGKAKNLKKRVRSYFNFNPFSINFKLSPRIVNMLSYATHIEYIVTNSEADSLILENSLIKQLKPKYNILLRDDKTYPYIYLNLNEDFPRFAITRRLIKKSNIRYFGPYFRGAKEILEAIYLKYKLVQKAGCQRAKKACLFYQIDRCYAPCENKISKDDYSKIVNEATQSLKNPKTLVPFLQDQMTKYAINESYEEAAKMRDSIRTIKESLMQVDMDLARLDDFDVVAIAIKENLVCCVKFSIRDGKIISSNSAITPIKDGSQIEAKESYKQAILDGYPEDTPSFISKIYLYESFDDIGIVEEILQKRHGKKIEILIPKIGEKRRICDIAYKNAEINIAKQLKSNDYQFLQEFKEYFKLNNLPLSIEAFDNSHLFGTACVGAIVAYDTNHFKKQNYRHYHLENKNDYDQMRELLTNRAKRFEKLSPPDLWVIDGGATLLELASSIVESSSANIDVIAIAKEKLDGKAYRAKGAAKDKIYTKNGEFLLQTTDKRLQFLQKLRDEAHRFAISFFKQTKQKRDLSSSKLKEIGISDAYIRKLLDYFGSYRAIYEADFDEIYKVTNKRVANMIKLGVNKESFKD